METIRSHRRATAAKLGVRSRASLAAIALRAGLCALSETQAAGGHATGGQHPLDQSERQALLPKPDVQGDLGRALDLITAARETLTRHAARAQEADGSVRADCHHFQIFLDRSPIASVVTDRSGSILFANRRARGLLGLADDAAAPCPPRNLLSLLSPDNAGVFHVQIQEIAAGRVLENWPIQLSVSAGQLPAMLSAEPVPAECGTGVDRIVWTVQLLSRAGEFRSRTVSGLS